MSLSNRPLSFNSSYGLPRRFNFVLGKERKKHANNGSFRSHPMNRKIMTSTSVSALSK
jgi:hypothetical protein